MRGEKTKTKDEDEDEDSQLTSQWNTLSIVAFKDSLQEEHHEEEMDNSDFRYTREIDSVLQRLKPFPLYVPFPN
mgnify:CR=1 FL=1